MIGRAPEPAELLAEVDVALQDLGDLGDRLAGIRTLPWPVRLEDIEGAGRAICKGIEALRNALGTIREALQPPEGAAPPAPPSRWRRALEALLS